jgi:hypothetical protein
VWRAVAIVPARSIADPSPLSLDTACKAINQPTQIKRLTPIPADPKLNAYYRNLLAGSGHASPAALCRADWRVFDTPLRRNTEEAVAAASSNVPALLYHDRAYKRDAGPRTQDGRGRRVSKSAGRVVSATFGPSAVFQLKLKRGFDCR